ncbi:twin-arginine translocation signal domain-containing protein [Acidiphilium acidophilum]|uniref:twin-arginine translocation signal domain-containing protein n=1 Tax=Acidiphilium acidophilum TaxID=76588 RepID=UPI0038D02068
MGQTRMKVSRRTFIRTSAVAGAVATPMLATADMVMTDGKPWPSVKVGNVNQLSAGKPVSFQYPACAAERNRKPA